MAITSKQLRESWLKFYESKGHVNVGAVSLIGAGLTLDQEVVLTEEEAAKLAAGTLSPQEDPQLQAALALLEG